MNKATLLLACLMMTISLSAQKLKDAVIEGNAPFAKGKEIRLLVFDDLLTYTTTVVARETIDKNGKFKLQYKTYETKMAQIAIMTAKAEFCIEPEKEYHLDIDADEATLQLVSPEEYGAFLQVTPQNTDTTELNYRINRFSNFFENIIAEYHPYFTYLKNKEKFDTMTTIINSHFDIHYAPTDFYSSWLYYTYASLEFSMYEKNHDDIYHKYLDNEYILYNNPCYMDFFNTFYDNYLYISRRISKSVLSENINDKPDYPTLFNEVGKDPLLQNERIRELVIIKNLWQFAGKPADFNKGNIISLLDYISAHTHFPEHKKIIENIKNRISRFNKGKDIKVTLKEVSGADFKFGKPSKRWTYVQFFNSQCEECIREMMILKTIQEKFKDSLQIVSISTDYNFNDFSNFRQRYDKKMFDWQFVHINGQYEWLEGLQLFSLPEYILLSPDGKLYERHTALPEKGAIMYFRQKFTPEDIEDSPLERH